VGLEKPILTHKDHKQRLPFSDETVGRLLDCAIALPRSGNGVRVSNDEIEAIMLLMIHVGPGLADASALNQKALSEIRDHSGEDSQCEGEDCDCQGKDWTYWRIKNGVKVDTSIPVSVVRKLLALPRYEGGFFFFNGWKGTKERTNCWQQILDLVFEMARVPKGESGTHRFRHTFAHRFLRSPDKKGGMYELSKAMGHRSVATTEKYYSAYIGEIAARVRSAVRSTWNRPKQVTA
jgi:integrase